MAASFAEELAALAAQHFCRNAGAMYGTATDLAPGAGVALRGVAYAVYNESNARFSAQKGIVLVLTHECDIDQDNNRPFNKHFVGIPLIFMDSFAKEYEQKQNEARILIPAIANGSVSRLFYLPPPKCNVPELANGALVYLNAMCSSHISQISSDPKDKIFALSAYGLTFADLMIQQHLLRPKSETLADFGQPYRAVTITGGPKT